MDAPDLGMMTRKILSLAEQAAAARRSEVGAAHVLLAMCAVPECVAARLLCRQGVNLGAAARTLRQVPARSERAGGGVDAPDVPTPHFMRRTLDGAAEEASRLNPERFVGTEHLLLALTADQDGAARRVLARLGVDVDTTRSLASRVHGPAGPH